MIFSRVFQQILSAETKITDLEQQIVAINHNFMLKMKKFNCIKKGKQAENLFQPANIKLFKRIECPVLPTE